ncbi:hypothetical protein [Occultella gossypii]|uniref:Uncharacterized protein n=1 Tax=Occultella gossypii TaxID=2800820 RepID=A0ABS7S8L5_9MICO|nr:hypothetical protein [Occultella gossypii]MBZ2195969.1 hypothetical protein [Occultella gossypii]
MTPEELWAVWVTAGATILAALVPGVLFFVELRGRKAAEAKLAERVTTDETAEVRRVPVWYQYVEIGLPVPGSDGVVRQPVDVEVYAHNLSADPIFDVKLHVAKTYNNFPPEAATPVPGYRPLPDVIGHQVLLLPQHQMGARLEGFGYASAHPGWEVVPPCYVSFKDVRGRRWWRSYSDEVEELGTTDEMHRRLRDLAEASRPRPPSPLRRAAAWLRRRLPVRARAAEPSSDEPAVDNDEQRVSAEGD